MENTKAIGFISAKGKTMWDFLFLKILSKFMESRNYVQMEEKKESKLQDDIRAHITVVDELPFLIADDDPFLVRKLVEAHKTFEEAPITVFILKRMREEG
ncbi:MAG TPA: hypothetical protein VG052_13080 [Puia sp.]|nr:hypothetical protein [Puia sp.]